MTATIQQLPPNTCGFFSAFLMASQPSNTRRWGNQSRKVQSNKPVRLSSFDCANNEGSLVEEIPCLFRRCVGNNAAAFSPEAPQGSTVKRDFVVHAPRNFCWELLPNRRRRRLMFWN